MMAVIHDLVAPELSEADQKRLKETLERSVDPGYIQFAFREMMQPVEAFLEKRKDMKLFMSIHVSMVRVGNVIMTCCCPMMFNYAPPDDFMEEKIVHPVLVKMNEFFRENAPEALMDMIGPYMDLLQQDILPGFIIATFINPEESYLNTKILCAPWILAMASNSEEVMQPMGRLVNDTVIESMVANSSEIAARNKMNQEMNN